LTPIVSVIDDGFDFVFLFVVNEVWWWSGEIGAMGGSFLVREKK